MCDLRSAQNCLCGKHRRFQTPIGGTQTAGGTCSACLGASSGTPFLWLWLFALFAVSGLQHPVRQAEEPRCAQYVQILHGRTFGWGHERYLASFSGLALMYSFSSSSGLGLTGSLSSRRSASSQIDRCLRYHVQPRYGKGGGAPSGFAFQDRTSSRVLTPWHAGASGNTVSDVKNIFCAGIQSVPLLRAARSPQPCTKTAQ